jgi:DNA polymerase-1
VAKLILIDGSGIFHRAYHAFPEISGPDGSPVNAVYGFTDILWTLLSQFREEATHIGMVFDAPGKNFRHDMYPEYKANRKQKEDNLVSQYSKIEEVTKAFNLPYISVPGYEADDVIATYATMFANSGGDVVLISQDKDLMQLVHDGSIEMYDPMKNKKIMAYDVYDKFGVSPDKVVDVLALMGDASDNVPGCPSIGIKTASRLVQEYGSAEQVIYHAQNIDKKKVKDAILSHVDDILLSKNLVILDRDVPVPHIIDDLVVRSPQPGLLYEFLDKMNFQILLSRLESETFE